MSNTVSGKVFVEKAEGKTPIKGSFAEVVKLGIGLGDRLPHSGGP